MRTDTRKIVITGASDGIGAAAARRLAANGHRVVLVGRSTDKTLAMAHELGAPSYVCDFADLGQVRVLAEQLRTDHADLDVLINNAGGIFGARHETVDGHELTLQVNHLAPFLLTHLLLDVLRTNGAAVLNTSSVANRLFGNLDLDDLGNATGYTARGAYGDSKLANILFTRELHRREHGNGITTAALHPGNVATNFASETNSLMRFVYHTPLRRLLLVSTERGSDNTVWLAEGTSGVDWASGTYYDGRRPGRVHPQADDAHLAEELWLRSAELVGVR